MSTPLLELTGKWLDKWPQSHIDFQEIHVKWLLGASCAEQFLNEYWPLPNESSTTPHHTMPQVVIFYTWMRNEWTTPVEERGVSLFDKSKKTLSGVD